MILTSKKDSFFNAYRGYFQKLCAELMLCFCSTIQGRCRVRFSNDISIGLGYVNGKYLQLGSSSNTIGQQAARQLVY